MNRTVAAVLLLIGGLLGLFMAACGGFFAIAGLFDSGRDAYLRGSLVLSLPSFLIGALLCWFVWKRHREWRAGGDIGLGLAGSATTPLAVGATLVALLFAGMLFGVVQFSLLFSMVAVVIVVAVVAALRRPRTETPGSVGQDRAGNHGDPPVPPPPPPPPPPLPPAEA